MTTAPDVVGDPRGPAPWRPPRAVGAGPGMAALTAAPRVDAQRLRAERRRAVLDAMAEAELDVLLLGREDNARYVSGARRLWTSGTRPPGPSCVVVADGDRVHLLTSWADGVPPEIPLEACYGTTWDGATLVGAVRAVPGVVGARRVGVDGAGVGARRLLAHVAPRATVVDAGPLLAQVRATKTSDELALLETAVAAAESCLVAAADGLRPGTTGRSLAGRFVERLGFLGVTTPAGPGVFGATDPDHPAPPTANGDQPLCTGQLVAGAGAVLVEGYRGDAAWSWMCPGEGQPGEGQPGEGRPGEAPAPLVERWQRVRQAMAAACRPGALASDLLEAWRDTGEPEPALPVAHGVGLGVEPPIVSAALPGAGDGRLRTGMVLALRGWLWAEGVGGLLAASVVHLTDGGVRPLSRLDGPW